METSRNTSVRICSKEEVYDTSSSSPAVSVTPVRVSKGRHEHSWNARGCIIYFFLHQALGRKCFRTTCKVFNVKVSLLVDPPLLTLTNSHIFICIRNFARMDLQGRNEKELDTYSQIAVDERRDRIST